MKVRYSLFFLLAMIISGCGRKYPGQSEDKGQSKEQLLETNKAVVHEESKAIDEFITRHEWKMEMTGTGLRYQIYEPGSGKQADASSKLTIAFQVYLLDGTLCYEAGEDHPLQLVAGRGEQISGLEEGLLMMQEGGKARFVIPNHLAYGLTGDQDRIPPASALYYDVHLIKVENLQSQK